jgi:hypothetical protein
MITAKRYNDSDRFVLYMGLWWIAQAAMAIFYLHLQNTVADPNYFSSYAANDVLAAVRQWLLQVTVTFRCLSIINISCMCTLILLSVLYLYRIKWAKVTYLITVIVLSIANVVAAFVFFIAAYQYISEVGTMNLPPVVVSAQHVIFQIINTVVFIYIVFVISKSELKIGRSSSK